MNKELSKQYDRLRLTQAKVNQQYKELIPDLLDAILKSQIDRHDITIGGWHESPNIYICEVVMRSIIIDKDVYDQLIECHYKDFFESGLQSKYPFIVKATMIECQANLYQNPVVDIAIEFKDTIFGSINAMLMFCKDFNIEPWVSPIVLGSIEDEIETLKLANEKLPLFQKVYDNILNLNQKYK